MGPLAAGIRVAVIAAMRQELRPVRKRYALRPEAQGSGSVWRGHAGAREIVAAVTSMGTEAAARWTGRLLDAYPAQHVIVVGIAGGIAPQLRIGDVLNPEVVVDERTGRSVHPTALGDAPQRGRLLTSDTLHGRDAVERLRSQGYLAVDMETAAIGSVAEARGVPWSVFRAISDFAGDAQIDREVMGLARPDGAPDLAAIARFALTRPWRLPSLFPLGRDMNRAIRAASEAVFRALAADGAA